MDRNAQKIMAVAKDLSEIAVSMNHATSVINRETRVISREMFREAIIACMARLDGEFSDLPRELELELFGSELTELHP